MQFHCLCTRCMEWLAMWSVANRCISTDVLLIISGDLICVDWKHLSLMLTHSWHSLPPGTLVAFLRFGTLYEARYLHPNDCQRASFKQYSVVTTFVVVTVPWQHVLCYRSQRLTTFIVATVSWQCVLSAVLQKPTSDGVCHSDSVVTVCVVCCATEADVWRRLS